MNHPVPAVADLDEMALDLDRGEVLDPDRNSEASSRDEYQIASSQSFSLSFLVE